MKPLAHHIDAAHGSVAVRRTHIEVTFPVCPPRAVRVALRQAGLEYEPAIRAWWGDTRRALTAGALADEARHLAELEQEALAEEARQAERAEAMAAEDEARATAAQREEGI